MRTSGFIGLGLLLLSAVSTVQAACSDPAQLQAARAVITAGCNCEGSPSPDSYRRCATAILSPNVAGGAFSPGCASAARRCAARSVCGQAGKVSCCITRPGRPTRCKVTAPERCTALGGCGGSYPSCCDACGPTGCVSTTTTTTTSTTPSTTIPSCGFPCYQLGCCDPDEVCMPSPTTGYCFKFRCDPGEACNYGYACTGFPNPPPGFGMLCAGLPGSLCQLPGFGGPVALPCVPPSTCQSGRCCLASGEPCSSNSACCGGTCASGACN